MSVVGINVLLAVASYWVCSIGLVFLNKYLLSGAGAQVNVPLFVTWCQCITTIAICSILSRWGNRKGFPKLRVDVRAMRDVLPLSIVFVAMISFNNLSLKYCGVSFYYIGRSLTTVFNVIFTFFLLGEKSSFKVISTCLLIVFGFVVGVDQEGFKRQNSNLGVFFGIFASLAVALNAILTKSILPKVENCLWKLTWYNNINAFLLFIPLMLKNGDLYQIITIPPTSQFWMTLFISGVFGFTMNYVTGWQIQATSPLTHNISATAKSAAQTLMAVFLYNEVKSLLWWSSNLIVLVGSALYTWVRRAEMSAEKQKKVV